MCHPVVDDQRLLVESLYPPHDRPHTQVAWIDRERGELGDLQALPVLDVSQSIRGGVGCFVLIWAGNPARLAAIRVGGGGGQIEAQHEYADGWSPAGDVVDWPRSRWIVAERRGAGRAAEDRRVRVYEIPSLRPIRELPGGAFAGTTGMACVGRSSVLAVVPQKQPRLILLFDVDSGRELVRLPISAVGEPGSWTVFTDPGGRFVGVRGLQWMQLFAVPPTGVSPAQATAGR